MTKEEALGLLDDYCMELKKRNKQVRVHKPTREHVRVMAVLADAAGMAGRFPSDGSENKAMRWLGYIQGVMVLGGYYTLEDVKNHSKHRTLFYKKSEGTDE